ncbi:nitrile hydratase subunit beta [Novosphingobium tardum]|uniref:Nitrile hydratase subunit beta n=1 Tax=Novosphingobium tardum TaxID=1538021 RepID=A0ABV8RQY6_9SPHN
MNGVHDLGGRDGMGPISFEPAEPVFHEDWERRVFAMHIAMAGGGYMNIDQFRHAIERMPAADYLATSYFEHWLVAVEDGCRTAGLLDEAIATSPVTCFPSHLVEAMVFGGSPARMELDAAPAFAVGAQIRARNIHPAGHTRLPWYVRGQVGCIVAHRGAFVFPDSHAHGLGPDPRHMYSVSFTAEALWGPDARNPRDTVQLELWEPYLEKAGQPS